MNIDVRPVEYKDVEAMRDLYRHQAHCQIVADSLTRRGLTDPYLLFANGQLAGYGAVRNKYDPGCLSEFYVLPWACPHLLPLFRELLQVSGATNIEAQTNMPVMLGLFYDCATDIVVENYLFDDSVTTDLAKPNGTFRRALPSDNIEGEAPAEWLIEAGGEIVALGGFLCHYNPPYSDVFMEVAEGARRQGYGSYFVQELKRACYEAGKRPAARCSPENSASRRTLERAGFQVCGRRLTGRVRSDL